MNRPSFVSILLILSIAALPMSPAASQQAASDEPVAGQQFDEEIVVTARHREEDVTAVPISISAVGGEAIEERRIDTLQELEHAVPNLVFGETGTSGETFVGLRGIGDFSRNIGFDTRVGVYIDGVFAGQSLAVDQGLADVAQIEVLRGPQGTLFGKNSSSGAINIITNRPELGRTSGRLTLGFGNLDNVYGNGLINVPLGDKASLRVSAVEQNQDGYIRNLLDGKKLMSNDHTLGRARLRIQPSESTDINLSIDVRQQDNDLLFLEPDAEYELAVGNPDAVPRFVVDQDAPLIDENDGWGAGLNIDHVLPSGHVLTSITGFRTVDRKVGSDEDATRASLSRHASSSTTSSTSRRSCAWPPPAKATSATSSAPSTSTRRPSPIAGWPWAPASVARQKASTLRSRTPRSTPPTTPSSPTRTGTSPRTGP